MDRSHEQVEVRLKSEPRKTKRISRSRKIRETEKARIRRMSHAERMDELRPVVFARDSWRCQVRSRVCTGQAHHAHHVRLRSQGGPDTVDNLLSICMECHRYIHDVDRAWAEEHGYIRSRSTLRGSA